MWNIPAEYLDFKKHSLGLKLSFPLSGGSHTTIKLDSRKLLSILSPIFILFILYFSRFYLLFILYFRVKESFLSIKSI